MTAPLSERALQRLLQLGAEADEPVAPARYRLVRELGRGGMGVVHEAVDLQLGRTVALKVLAGAFGADDELRLRLQREALAAARLRHPHIAAVHDATADWIAMQLVRGGPIDTVPRQEVRRLVGLLRDAARAVQHAHEQGIVHRDLKPSNLLVEGDHVFVVDFGLAKEIAVAGPSLPGTVVGTPAFMPPEQAEGRTAAVDARSDVYALGATLHCCLTGAPPFAAASLPELLAKIVDQDPPRTGVDADLDVLLQKCLAKEPARRYGSAGELADDLDRWLRHEPLRARPPSPGYRLRLFVRRRRQVLRAAAVAVAATAVVLVPIALAAAAARNAASAALALSAQAATVLRDAETYRRLGDLASAHQSLDAGIAQARAFLAVHDVAAVHHLLGRLLAARDFGEQALAELQRAVEADPTLAAARFEHGVLLAGTATGDAAGTARAIAELATTVDAGGALTDIELLFGRAERHRLQGELALARQELEEVLAYDAAHVAARRSLAAVMLALGDADGARHVAASAIDLQLGFGPVYLARQDRRLPTAILGFDAALCDLPGQLDDEPDQGLAMARRGAVQLRRAVRLLAEGRAAEARAAAEAAVADHDAMLQLHPDCAEARVNRAACLLLLDRLLLPDGDSGGAAAARQRAADDLRQAMALAPGLPAAPFDAALVALRTAALATALGRPAAAEAAREQAALLLQQARQLAPPDWPHLPALEQARQGLVRKP